MEQLFHERDVISTNGAVTSNAIRSLFSRMRDALNAREDALLSTVQKYTDVKLTKLDAHHQKLDEDRKAILEIVNRIQNMVQDTRNASILMERQTITEELDLHQQSVLGIEDSPTEEALSSRFLSFREDTSPLQAFDSLGTLNECRREPNSVFLSVRRVVVTKDEDPYLDVPLRFEDESSAPQGSVRVDETHQELQLSSTNGLTEDSCYDYPRPMSPQPKIELPKPPAHRTKGSPSFDAPKCPPVPPRPPRRTKLPIPPAHSSNLPPCSPRLSRKTPPPVSPKPAIDAPKVPPRSPAYPSRKPRSHVNDSSDDIYNVPRLSPEQTDDTYDTPRNLMVDVYDRPPPTNGAPNVPPRSPAYPSPSCHVNSSSDDIYNVPRLSLEQAGMYDTPRNLMMDVYDRPPPMFGAPKIPPRVPAHPPHSPSSSDDTYDIPRSPIERADDTYDTPRSPMADTYDIPPRRTPTPKPKPGRSFSASQCLPIDSSDEESYEPIDDLVPTPMPRKKPPPLPPNHPSQQEKPVPRARRSVSVSTSLSVAKMDKAKRRSRTLPIGSNPPSFPEDDDILEPVLLIGKEDLCLPFSRETVSPCGVFCTSMDDIIVVTDVFNHCLRLVDSTGKFIEKVGREGRGGGQFKEPSAVVISPDNHIFVAERDNPRVQKFNANRKYISKFGQKVLWGSQLSDPWGLAVNANGDIYVSDWDKSAIYVFNPAGKLLFVINPKEDELRFPAGMAFDNRGRLLVADRKSHCVRMLSPSGDYIGAMGSQGNEPGQLYFPYGIAVTAKGNIIVTESGNNRVSVFSTSGRFLECFGRYGSDPGMFNHPRHVCVNSTGQVIVADEMNQRLQVFELDA